MGEVAFLWIYDIWYQTWIHILVYIYRDCCKLYHIYIYIIVEIWIDALVEFWSWIFDVITPPDDHWEPPLGQPVVELWWSMLPTCPMVVHVGAYRTSPFKSQVWLLRSYWCLRIGVLFNRLQRVFWWWKNLAWPVIWHRHSHLLQQNGSKWLDPELMVSYSAIPSYNRFVH